MAPPQGRVAAPTVRPLAGMPEFYSLVVDDARQVLYGTDINGGKLYILSMADGSLLDSFLLGADQWSRPLGMDLSPDGSRLAVALSSAPPIAIVDLNTRKVVQRLTIHGRLSDAVADLRYGRPGRLYTVGDGFLHIIDTTTGTEIGSTNNAVMVNTPHLTITADKRWLYMIDGGDSAQFVRWDISTDSPVETNAPSGEAGGMAAVVRPDGSQVYTTSGQVWTSGLEHELGNFAGAHTYGSEGRTLIYSPATDRIFAGCGCYGVQEIRAGGFPYPVVGDRQLHGAATAMGTNAAGTVLYVSSSVPWNPVTGNGTSQLEILDLTVPPMPRYRPSDSGTQPLLDTLLMDSGRNVLYGSDMVGGRIKVLSAADGRFIASIDVGQYHEPLGMDISPDGSQLAVALGNAAQILLIDLGSRTVARHLYPAGGSGVNTPFDVRYGSSGRLYSSGAPCAYGSDYIHAFDTTSGVQVGASSAMVRCSPRLAISADRTSLFVMESAQSPETLWRFDVSSATPTVTSTTGYSNSSVAGYEIALRPDGTQVYTTGGNVGNGQVWSADLKTQLGTIADHGPNIAYSAAASRVFIGNGHGVSEALDTAPYTLVHTWTQTGTNGNSGKTGPVAISPDGLTIYLSTDSGIVMIPRGQPGPPTNVVAKAGNGQATVSWAAPAITGASPITSYTVTEWRFTEPPLTFVFKSPATTQVISGLTNGRAYSF
ncbi:MAG: hypothetical protein M3Z28_11440, partial [Candidatus Dormibacteraeota bacterium]|nr:hypothetical protein [Candidatus Dormibacteraeota bacterium]